MRGSHRTLLGTHGASIAGAGVSRSNYQRYIPIVAMALLAAIGWVPYIFHIGQPNISNHVTVWGVNPDRCYQVVDGSSVIDYSAKYNVALACGFNTATVDRMQDGLITISNSFTIHKEQVAMEVKYSPAMIETIKGMITSVPVQPPTIWTQSFLLPKSVDVSRIKRLSDIREFGGKLITNCEPIE
jgi:hypothetical protein